jgi:hypothetical protein
VAHAVLAHPVEHREFVEVLTTADDDPAIPAVVSTLIAMM